MSAELISQVALAVSVAGLALSVMNYRRDRANLKITSRRYTSSEGPGYIEVKAVNLGRRPVNLVMLKGSDGWRRARCGQFLDYGGPGLKLEEREFVMFQISCLARGKFQFEPYAMYGDDDELVEFDRMWVEDSSGKLHRVPGLRSQLKELRIDYREWCDRTGYWTAKPMSTW